MQSSSQQPTGEPEQERNEWRYTVDVKRTKTSYPVLLTVQEIGGSWKITYIDRY
jgi:hypothetical protein